MNSRAQQCCEASLKPWLDVCGLEAWYTEALDWGGLQFVPTPRRDDEHQMWCKDSVEEALRNMQMCGEVGSGSHQRELLVVEVHLEILAKAR